MGLLGELEPEDDTGGKQPIASTMVVDDLELLGVTAFCSNTTVQEEIK